MDLTKSTFSGTSDRVEKDEEAQKRAAEQSLHTIEGQKKTIKAALTGESREENKELASPLQNDKEKAASVVKGVANDATSKTSGSTENDDGDTPRKLPAVKAPEAPIRPPITPRKNVIPSRRAAFDHTRTPSTTQKGTGPIDDAQEADRGKQPAIIAPSDEVPALETSLPPLQHEIQQEAADGSISTDLPSNNADGPGLSEQTPDVLFSNNADGPGLSEQAPDLPAFANLSVTYHDTSAAEKAWQVADRSYDLPEQDTHILAAAPQTRSDDDQQMDRQSTAEMNQRATLATIETRKMATPTTPLPPVSPMPGEPFIDVPTTPMPVFGPVKPLERQRSQLTRKKALFLALLLAIILVNATATGFNQFFGPQGWGSAFNNNGNTGLKPLTQIAQQLQHTLTPGTKGTPTPPTPAQIVNLLMSNMTLDQKLGQMMMVQFLGQSYSPDLDTMISQYHVGSVLYFQFNIGSKSQLTGLNAQMQHNASLPLLVAVDQEGGTVDRLINLDGPQPPAAQIGATGNPNVAYQQGSKDAQDLASYGFNLNLAPVVDVNNVYNSQLYNRTYGDNPTIVTQMAEKYLEGLQKSGKVLGTLKHFPGLGDVSTDPHYGLPALTRSLNSLNSIDWAPYSNLIKQGNVYSIMVTHEIVDALDQTEPSSLSPQVIGILRNQMHFQGVIITDSLTMDSIHNFYTYGEAAAKAVEAGDDILMGADSPDTLAQMISGIKQAMGSGAITQSHIDDSVRRILLFKYQMGLLHV